MGKSLQIATGLRLPGSELLDTADASHSAFGLKKLAVCTTGAGKIYALDMADGSVAWYVNRSFLSPSWRCFFFLLSDLGSSQVYVEFVGWYGLACLSSGFGR